MKNSKARARGAFTLLELLVVVAILAVLGGALLVSYDGLEDDAASAHSGFNISASDRAMRTFSTLNNTFPSEWDSVLAGDASVSPFVGSSLLDRLNSDLSSQLIPGATSAGDVAALNAAGITTVRNINTTGPLPNDYSNDSNFTNDSVSVPNRIFDDNTALTGFYGASQTLTVGDQLAYIVNLSALETKFGLGAADVAVVLGLGNKNTIHDGSYNGALSQTPFGRVSKGQYGRFLAVFLVWEGGSALNKARFLGMIDAKGNILDEAIADFTEGNN